MGLVMVLSMVIKPILAMAITLVTVDGSDVFVTLKGEIDGNCNIIQCNFNIIGNVNTKCLILVTIMVIVIVRGLLKRTVLLM